MAFKDKITNLRNAFLNGIKKLILQNESTPITSISNALQNFFGKYEVLTLIITVLLFVLFVFSVIYKNFFGEENVIIKFFNKDISFAQIISDNLSNIVSFFIDFVALPLLILSVMFNITKDYTASIEQAVNNALLSRISTDLDKVKQAQTDLRNFYSEKNLERASEPELCFSSGPDKLNVDKPYTNKTPSEGINFDKNKINKNINMDKPSSNDEINFDK